jgi:type II secretory pathway pseudopilin PulG
MDENLNRNSALGDANDSPTRRHRRAGTLVALLVVVAIIGLFICFMLLPSVRAPREASRRNQCRNNLKQIALAIRNYAEVHQALPPAYTTDASGKPLHSWRTLILPFMEEQALYETIDLTKPWDDPVNATALNTKLPVYQCPSTSEDDNRTTYLAILTPNSCFRATEPRSLSEITDKASQTLLVIEVDTEHAVPWMSPVDANESFVMKIGEPNFRPPHPAGMQAAFVDCHVGILRDDIPADQLRAMLSIAGNDNTAVEGAK